MMSDSSDPFHVMGNDGVIRTLVEHYDGQKDVEQDPYGAWLAIHNQADRIEELEAQLAAIEEYGTEEINEAVDLRQQLAKAVDAVVDVAASLTAALYLLERGGKKAAPSDKMFAQMLVDYSASLDRARATIKELKGELK